MYAIRSYYEVKHAVNNAPCQIATERADEHRVNIIAPRPGNTERAGESEDHDQPKQELRDAINRVNLWNGNLLKKTSPINEPKQKIVALFEMLEQWIEDNNFRGCAFLNTLSETPDPESPLREIIAQHKEDLRFEIGRLLDACGSDKGKYRDIVFLLFEGAS